MVILSWLSDAVSKSYSSLFGGSDGVRNARAIGLNGLADFMESEIAKSDLRGAEVEGVLSGLPVVGDVIRGVEGVNQMEDLYSNTGKVPNYPGSQNLGTSALAHVPGDISRKIEGGSHDLAEFYSGDRNINDVFDRINNMEFKSSVRGNTTKSGETGWIKVI